MRTLKEPCRGLWTPKARQGSPRCHPLPTPGKGLWSCEGLWTAGPVQCWSQSRICWWGSSTSSWWGSSLGPSCSLQGSCWGLDSCVIPSFCTPRRITAQRTCMTPHRLLCWWLASPSWCLSWSWHWQPTAVWLDASSWATASSPTAKPSTRTCQRPATTTLVAAAPRTPTWWKKSGFEGGGLGGHLELGEGLGLSNVG